MRGHKKTYQQVQVRLPSPLQTIHVKDEGKYRLQPAYTRRKRMFHDT